MTRSKVVLFAVLASALCGIGATVFWFGKRQKFTYVPTKQTQTWVAPNEYTFYDTKGKIPGDPAKTVAHMKNTVYKAMLVYKQRYGRWPLDDEMHPLRPPFEIDMSKNPAVYGYTSKREAFQALENSEGLYGDAWQGKGFETANLVPYYRGLSRPNGTRVGEFKPEGTRDVLAYADMYFHNNQHHFTKNPPASVPKNLLTENHPVGFYLVLWDDGQVEQIPWEKVRFTMPTGYTCFPGQAGVNWDKTLTYAERQVWWLKPENRQILVAYNKAHGIY